MNSTKPSQKNEETTLHFLEGPLLALAERLSTFARHPDPAAESYYAVREQRRMTKTDFELASGLSNTKVLGETLKRMWDARGEAALSSLAEDLAALAQELKREEDQSGEVSPFVYVMY